MKMATMIDQNFTHQAPVEYLDDSGENLQEVTQHYAGPDKFKVLVNRESGAIETVCWEYTDGLDMGNDRVREQLLDFANTNHQVLMDMLTNCDGYDWNGPTMTEDLGTVEGYQMSYSRPIIQNTLHYFEINDIRIDNDGVVSYAWKKNHMDWERLATQLNWNIEEAKKERDAVSLDDVRARFDKLIRIFEHMKYNMRSVAPHKIPFPSLDDIA